MLPLLALAALVIAPAQASAAKRYYVGLGEQNAAVFDQPAFQSTGIKRMRYLVPWDWNRVAGIRAETEGYLDLARARGKDVYVTFTAKRGCWTGRYSRSKACRAPSTTAYRRSLQAFRKRFPWIKTFGTWNEANHKSQPTASSPKRAARYYNVMRRYCKKCTVVAINVLDQSNAVSYLKRFDRYAKGSPRRWGLHNYADVNRKRSRGITRVLKAVRGELWLTETGGIVKFGKSFPYSESRAAARTKYLFRLADKYSKKRRGHRSRIKRVYVYDWFGEPAGARFDAGLTDINGNPRPALKQFVAGAKRARR